MAFITLPDKTMEDSVEESIKKLREEYIKFPLKREIIKRQVIALGYGAGKDFLKDKNGKTT